VKSGPKTNVGAVILAAGESSRFGQPKQLVQFRGRALIDNVVDAAKKASCDPIIVVTGSDSAKIIAALKDNKVISTIENRRWRVGMGSSIRAGMRHLIKIASETRAVILLVCDQPFVTASTVAGLIDSWSVTGKSVVASSYVNTLGVPALFDSSCFIELLGLKDDRGAKSVIQSNPDRVAAFPFPEGACDIDTVEDYESLE
jgi:molybdenum cofactor cytidylyltransferase